MSKINEGKLQDFFKKVKDKFSDKKERPENFIYDGVKYDVSWGTALEIKNGQLGTVMITPSGANSYGIYYASCYDWKDHLGDPNYKWRWEIVNKKTMGSERYHSKGWYWEVVPGVKDSEGNDVYILKFDLEEIGKVLDGYESKAQHTSESKVSYAVKKILEGASVRKSIQTVVEMEDSLYIEQAAELLDRLNGDQLMQFANEYGYDMCTYAEFSDYLNGLFAQGKNGYNIYNDLIKFMDKYNIREGKRVLEGKLVPDENGIIVLGDLARGKSITSIDLKSLTDDNAGDEVWVLFHDTHGYYDDNDEWQKENCDYIKKGIISDVSIYPPDFWNNSERVHVQIKFVDGKTYWAESEKSLFSRIYTPKEAAKLVDASNKRKGIDAAVETLSSEGLKDRANLKHLNQIFNSVDYGEDASITIGCTDSYGRGGSQITLYCYVSPKGGGHVNHGSTIEVGYTYVNGKLKRHLGAFDMPAGRGWIDNPKVQATSLAQFDKDVKLLKDVQANPEKYSTNEIMQKLK